MPSNPLPTLLPRPCHRLPSSPLPHARESRARRRLRLATLCALLTGFAASTFDIDASQSWGRQDWSTNRAVPSLAGDLPVGPLAHYELAGGTGTTIPNVITGGGALPPLTLYGSDFRRAGNDLFLNEHIGGFTRAFPFDPNNGTFAYSSGFPNTFASGGTWALRLRVDSSIPPNLGAASSSAIITFRPEPEFNNNPHRVAPRAIEFHREGPTDPLQLLVREGANSIGYNNEFNDEVRSLPLTATSLTVDRTVVIAFDAQRLRIFVDGVLHGTTNRLTVDNPATAYRLFVGAQSSLIHGQDRQFYQGAMRSLVIYDRLLTDTEIGDLSFALSGTIGPPPTDCVVSEWSNWQPTSAFSACTNNLQSRNEERTRTILTLPQNGGLACPALSDTRVVTQPCTAGGGNGISVTPPSVSITTPHGTVPAPITLTVSTPNGGGFSTQESSTFFDASCFNVTCPSGGTVTVNLSGVFFSNADPGTYSSPLTIHANGFASVVVPITIVVSSSSGGPGPGPGPVGPPPSAPRRFSRTVRQNTVSLAWQPPISGGAPSGYVVEAGMASGQTIYSFPAGLLTNVDVPGVAPGRYYVRVKAVNALGVSPASNEEVVTVGCTGAPAAPQSLTAAVNGNAVSLHWVDGDGCSDTRYRLRVGSAPGVTNLADFPVNTTDFTTFAPPGTYYVRVVKTTPFGESQPSNEVAVAVGSGACTPPGFPTWLEIQLAGRQATAFWGPSDEPAAVAADEGLPLAYVLELGSGPGLANLGSASMGRAMSVTSPVAPGTYYVRVRLTSACGVGPASNEVTLRVP